MGCAAEKLEMPMKPDIEEELRRYLGNASWERQGLKKSLDNIANQILLHDQKDEQRFNEFASRLRGVESRLSGVEKDSEDTGKWVIRQRMRERWWKRQGWKVVIEIVKMVVVLAVGAGAAHLAWH